MPKCQGLPVYFSPLAPMYVFHEWMSSSTWLDHCSVLMSVTIMYLKPFLFTSKPVIPTLAGHLHTVLPRAGKIRIKQPLCMCLVPLLLLKMINITTTYLSFLLAILTLPFPYPIISSWCLVNSALETLQKWILMFSFLLPLPQVQPMPFLYLT